MGTPSRGPSGTLTMKHTMIWKLVILIALALIVLAVLVPLSQGILNSTNQTIQVFIQAMKASVLCLISAKMAKSVFLRGSNRVDWRAGQRKTKKNEKDKSR